MIRATKGFAAVALMLCLAASLAMAAPPRVAVGDFTVTSDNPKLKYVGKGLAEMVAAQLSASKGVTLIDRDKREAALGELEFSLSGMADTESQIEAGKLLTADYLLFGEIIDMDSAVLVSCKIVKVETGEVPWNDKNLGPLADYDGISRKMAASALKGLGVSAVAAAPAKPAPAASEAKKVEAIVAFSGAVDALDKNDDAEAKRQIQVAAAIDKSNPAVAAYLAKLVANSTKFKVLLEPYYSYLNPAFLGIMRTDMLFFSGSMPVAPIFYSPPMEGINYSTIGTNRHIMEVVSGGHLGYALPLGESLGFRAEIVQGAVDSRGYANQEVRTGYPGSGMSARASFGGIFGFGWALSPGLSVGAGIGAMAHSKKDSNPGAVVADYSGLVYGADLGFLLRDADESLVFDSRIGFTSATNDDLDPSTLTLTGTETGVPLYLENTLTAALGGRSSFFIVKQINEIGYQKGSYFGTIMPAAEHFFGSVLSLRLGVEGSLLASGGSPTLGYGALGGITLRVIPWGMDLDLNASYRMRPSRIVEGVLYPEFLILLNATWNGVFKKSR